jgi:hypothetical protein
MQKYGALKSRPEKSFRGMKKSAARHSTVDHMFHPRNE